MEVFNIRKYKDNVLKTKVGEIEKCCTIGMNYYKVKDLNDNTCVRKSLITCKDLLKLNDKSYKELLKKMGVRRK